MELRPRHAARRRGASDAAIPGAGRLHGDGRCGHARRGVAGQRQRLRQGLRPVSALARGPHGAHRSVGTRNGPHLPRQGSRASGTQRTLAGPLAGALLRCNGMALWVESRELPGRPDPWRNAMSELGRLEDLPPDYVAALRAQNLVPLWPSLRAVLPPDKPQLRTHATHWPYEVIRPLLLKAGELTPIEKAERRVLVLANPGHGLEKMQASAAM